MDPIFTSAYITYLTESVDDEQTLSNFFVRDSLIVCGFKEGEMQVGGISPSGGFSKDLTTQETDDSRKWGSSGILMVLL